MESNRLAIPRLLWDSLEASLLAEAKHLTKEIAKTLGQPESELWREVSREKFSAYLVDMMEPTNEIYQCRSYSTSGRVQKPCKQPVIFGTRLCPEHTCRPIERVNTALPQMRVLKYYDEDDSVEKECYLDPATNTVLEKDTLTKIGEWNTDTQALTLFTTD